MTDPRAWTPIQLTAAHAPPVGAYSPAVEAGGLIFVSGQVPRDPVTGAWEKDKPIADQARRVLSNVQITLEAAGLGLGDVASVTVYLANIGDWAAVNQIYQEYFRPPFPARAIVGASLEGFLIEIAAVAVRPRSPEAAR